MYVAKFEEAIYVHCFQKKTQATPNKPVRRTRLRA
ncbi:type II toxin-antitoxin system RelE/ParE family toxin [Mycetohabitans rhizoxinica]